MTSPRFEVIVNGEHAAYKSNFDAAAELGREHMVADPSADVVINSVQGKLSSWRFDREIDEWVEFA